MEIRFHDLRFDVTDNRLRLMDCAHFHSEGGRGIAEVQIAGENKPTHMGAKLIHSSEGNRLRYVSHEATDRVLCVVQESELVRVKTLFVTYDDTNAVRVHTSVQNISDRELVLEEVSSFVLGGVTPRGTADTEGMYFTRFHQSHHAECQPRRVSFGDLGLFGSPHLPDAQKRIAFANIGSWSTKEELPQGIIEDAANGRFAMFQIESNSTWYYELSDVGREHYLWLGGASLPFGGWSKALRPGESYRTVAIALAFGETLDGVIGEMTKYRRHIAGQCEADAALPTIFNEYMHLSWDSPTEENTRIYAPVVAKTGVEYYVIDCGWHNEEPGNVIYPYVGQWKESRARFPNGVRATTDFIRSLGMKAGLWIEPEIIGVKCQEMLDYYTEDCFIQRYGRRLAVMNRHFLDYRHPKVRAYMTETIRRMVEDYGADYIKFDYNQDMGVGTDRDALTAGEGLETCTEAFFSWVEEMKARYPGVILEGCSSGGMRMDYRTLRTYSLVSTSDQTNYLKYPYIAGNILAAVIPEQAAVWSYPVGACTSEEINDDQIVMNMINSFLGRMHLASHLERMNDHQLGLVREGVAFYETLNEVRKRGLPILPWGFTRFGAKQVCAGLRDGSAVYLAVWCLGEELFADIPLPSEIVQAKITYPSAPAAVLSHQDNRLCVTFDRPNTAVFLEVRLG
jgi:alpha-galactosidase